MRAYDTIFSTFSKLFRMNEANIIDRELRICEFLGTAMQFQTLHFTNMK